LSCNLTLAKFRETIVNEVPKNLKITINAGIDFIIAFVGFTDAICSGVVLGTFTGIRYVKCIRSRGKTGLTSVVVARLFSACALHIAQLSRCLLIYDISGPYHGRNFHD